MNTLKRLAVAITAATMLSTGAIATETFYKDEQGWFEIHGFVSGADGNPTCQIDAKYNDGSYFSLVKDMTDDEVWMELHNTVWKSLVIKRDITISWAFHKKDGEAVYVQESNAGQIINVNTVQIRNLNPDGYNESMKTFINLFQSSHAMSFQTDLENDGIQNRIMWFRLPGSRKAINSVINCVNVYKAATKLK